MRQKGPAECPFDLIVATLVAGELAFSLASAAIVLYFQFRASGSCRFRRLIGLNSLWPVRLLLVVLASLLSLFELLRLPLLRHHFPSPVSPRLCAAHSVLSPSLAEPAFFSTLLFLLRASTNLHKPPNSPAPSSTVASFSLLSATAFAVAASLPFIFLHTLFLSLPKSILLRLGLPPYFLGHAAADAFSPRRARAHRCNPCGVSLFSTVLLAALAAVYVPLFISAIWSAVAIVINKRLRIRLYALSATVTAALSVQIVARALAALWVPASAVSQVLNLVSFVALLVGVVAGEAILVVQPIVESLVVVDADKRLRSRGDQWRDGSGGV